MEVYTENVGGSGGGSGGSGGLGGGGGSGGSGGSSPGGGGDKAVDLPIAMVPQHGAASGEADFADAYLWIDGEPAEPVAAEHDPAIWHRAGTITVTISPDTESTRRTPR